MGALRSSGGVYCGPFWDGGLGVVLILCGSVVYTARRFVLGLALLFVCMFLLSFWLDGEMGGGWYLCLSCICELAVRALVCVTVSLPPGVRDWLRLLLVALLGLFCLPFRTKTAKEVDRSDVLE